MRELFSMDMKNYIENGTSFSRPSVRGVIIKNKKVALIHSKKYDFYKVPGGGIENGESLTDALLREVNEETGFYIIKDSIKEYGHVLVKEKGSFEDLFIQDNYYFLCDIEDKIGIKKLDPYEIMEEYEVEFVNPKLAIDVNLNNFHNDYSDLTLLKRETKFLQLLIEEGLL